MATPRRTLYYVEEGTTLSIFFDFLDANGNPAPIEDTLTIGTVTCCDILYCIKHYMFRHILHVFTS